MSTASPLSWPKSISCPECSMLTIRIIKLPTPTSMNRLSHWWAPMIPGLSTASSTWFSAKSWATTRTMSTHYLTESSDSSSQSTPTSKQSNKSPTPISPPPSSPSPTSLKNITDKSKEIKSSTTTPNSCMITSYKKIYSKLSNPIPESISTTLRENCHWTMLLLKENCRKCNFILI